MSKKRIVSFPITVPYGDYCWEYNEFGYPNICEYYDNEGGHNSCQFDFYDQKETKKGVLKPEKCRDLKTISNIP